MTETNRQIVQIIPAQNWYAAFNNIDTGAQYYTPLACWALLAEGNRQFITGMVAVEQKIVACAEDANFSHYLYEAELDIGEQPQDE